MRKVKIGECLKVKHGWAFKGEYFRERGVQSILTPGNFYEKGGFKPNGGKERYYIGHYPQEYLCHKGDLIIAMTQQAEGLLGSTAIVPENGKYLHNQRIGLITCDESKLFPLFAYYLFMTKSVRIQLERSASGTKVKHTSPEKIYEVLVSLPEVEQQKNIATILYAVEEKENINKRINENLEQQLRTIYDYWFTQFDFPDEKGKPYRSSGGKMVWNEELKREIPEGWSVKKLSEICSTILGGTPSTTCSEYWNGTINWLNSGEVAQFPVVESAVKITESGLNNSPTELMPPGTTIISITGNIRASVLAIEACANQSVVGILETVELKYPFIHQFFLRKLNGFLVISTGNCQRHINKGTIDDTKILLPSPEILAKYYKITQPLYKAIMTMGIENKKLSNLRDWLLPMLMNGQATVAD